MVVASGANFSESVAARAEFFFSSELSPQSSPARRAQSQVAIKSLHRSRSALIFHFFPEPMQFFPLSQIVLHRSRSLLGWCNNTVSISGKSSLFRCCVCLQDQFLSQFLPFI